ncbi:hypothetical protein ABE29_22990 [Cytobacillus firmus]|uniref:DUF960 family protein n=1 Tax=Cytobacillus firmus TaxID=1399 RepID=UPI00077C908B|nr:DUF960 family protein [Cytobacillus firmus]MBG9545510.1 hypothetical protein [Cytobacillus firmus]MBG9551175.1 hypothetical protein [Cytobacillus firmus]MBG9557957.1 hypothetical protein [Cytobacillus firmus]MBG9577581.1 hypothetical protein [Cytobacillus firmus]MEC1891657.1 DUF960 family protein [Cytobacillus firmus]
MFKNQNERYMTRGIAEAIHPEMALFLWHLIDRLKEKEMEVDYLQVFELSELNGKQFIIHRQEQPPYKEQLMVQWEETEPLTSTIWCIDNGEGQIMLFPEEY